jgi:hypothetical protein
MIARLDHRPRLTAALALATTVLVVVVVTLTILLITAPPAVAPPTSAGDNPPVMGAGGEHYGEQWNNYGHDFVQPNPAQTGDGAVNDHFGRV